MNLRKLDWHAASHFLLERAAEPSTWAGLLVSCGTVVGHYLLPDNLAAISSTLAMLGGAVLMLTKEQRHDV